MNLKEVSKRLLPPIAIDAGRWFVKQKGSFTPMVDDTRVRFKYGDFFMECDSSHNLPRILIDLPDFGRNLAEVVLALQVPQPRVIDIGANIGDTALLLARFAPGTNLLCVEGDARFVVDLKNNTSQITGVTIAQAILSDRSSTVKGKFVATHGTAHFVQDEGGDVLEVKSLDDLLRDYPQFCRPHLIKIDTDGFDSVILRGAKGVLASLRPVVFYEWHPYWYGVAGENDVDHAQFLMAQGYDRFMIYTNRGHLLLRVRNPGPEVWESLADFSRERRCIDGWHYDVVAFPPEKISVWERLARKYATATRMVAPVWPMLRIMTSQFLSDV